MADPTENPSQIHGHATYVAGAAKEAFGFESGAADKEYAVKEMRAAKEQSEASGGEPAKNETVGKIESKLGNVTGCEGMVDEGKERQS
ncbi:MAG: hypothetical protein Q9195_005360 [Heterodermia aff. obscurata]